MLGWAAGFVGVIWLSVAFWPSVRESADEFTKLMERLPEALKALFGANLDFGTPAGYLNSRVFSLTTPVMLLIVAIATGTAGVAGEEDRGTLDVVLSTPVKRRRVVLETFAAMFVEVAMLSAVMWLAIVAIGPLYDLDVSPAGVAAASASQGLLAVLFGAVGLAVGAAIGRKGLATAAATGLAVGTFLVNGLGGAVESLEPYRPLTPWYHAVTIDPLQQGLGVEHLAYLVVIPLVLLAIAVWGFERRDVGT
jgi:ABC-2 type transport system permease protein